MHQLLSCSRFRGKSYQFSEDPFVALGELKILVFGAGKKARLAVYKATRTTNVGETPTGLRRLTCTQHPSTTDTAQVLQRSGTGRPLCRDTSLRCIEQRETWRKQFWAAKKPKLTLRAVTHEPGRPLHDPGEAGRRLCRNWVESFSSRYGIVTSLKTIVKPWRNTSSPPADTIWDVSRKEFEELFGFMRESAPELGGAALQRLKLRRRRQHQSLARSLHTPPQWRSTTPWFRCQQNDSQSRTPSISTARLIRAPDALRPLTLCNCGCAEEVLYRVRSLLTHVRHVQGHDSQCL